MLAICNKDGVTVGSKLYLAGDVFVLTGSLETDYASLTDERWIKKQNKVYGEVLFRRPTSDELRKAIAEKKITEVDIKGALDNKQLKVAMEYLKSKHLAQAKAAEAFLEKAEMEISEPEEEKVEVEKAPEEAPAEEEKVSEEEKTEGEEAPDKTDTPPEEPVKESPKPKKKDKEKGKN